MKVKIFPARLAESLKDHAGEKYRPANGTEGEIFIDRQCSQCQKNMDGTKLCDIIADTMLFNVDEDEYPSEWVYGADGQPCCTAFVATDEPGVFRDPLTVDMFGGVA